MSVFMAGNVCREARIVEVSRTQREASLISIVGDRSRLLWKYQRRSGVWFWLTLFSVDPFHCAHCQSVNANQSSHWKSKLATISLVSEECTNLRMFHLYLFFQYHRNQRNRGPLWWRLAAALLSLLFDRGFIAGGGGAGRRWGGSSFISLRNWTPNGTVKFNTGLFLRGKRKETKCHRGTETTNFYTRSCVFFLSKKMPWCSEIPPQDNVHILVYVWCSSFVQSIFLSFLHFNMYSSLMTSTDPGNALFSVFCQNEYWAILTGKMRWLGNERKCGVRFSFLKFSQVTWQVDLLISKEATSQNKAFCTSPQWNIYLFMFSLFCLSIFVFLLLHFLRYGIKFEHDPSASFKILGTK